MLACLSFPCSKQQTIYERDARPLLVLHFVAVRQLEAIAMSLHQSNEGENLVHKETTRVETWATSYTSFYRINISTKPVGDLIT